MAAKTETDITRDIAELLGVPSPSEIQPEVARLCRTISWVKDFAKECQKKFGATRGEELYRKYQAAFPVPYREEFSPSVAVSDLERMETVSADGQELAMHLYKAARGEVNQFHIKIYRGGQQVRLHKSLPAFENLGAQVISDVPYKVEKSDASVIWINDFILESEQAPKLSDAKARARFEDLVSRISEGKAENDGFNRLALWADLDWREIQLIRALHHYFRQAGRTFSQAYVEQCLAKYGPCVRKLVHVFLKRLDPQNADEAGASKLEGEIRQELQAIRSLDEDRILNAYLSGILGIRRTNYFQMQPDGNCKPYLSFKLESGQIPFLPQPRPLYEIWVYSPRVEGIHLRGSKVARGGIRWSDRMEDFRTEVLGLMKAQMVKNAVIVPMGSKGGFVCKLPTEPKDRRKEAGECYCLFISGLLDLTDNLVKGKIVPPSGVRRLDDDDPYLVVAADKGTSSFSDVANEISARYGFWLGDAFASGGSAGYDHKKIGITSRGVWEAVKRHFRHLGMNIQTADFSVIGIGDMSGDVFGNGMLRSEHIRLLAAFDHRHIFLDPSPDRVMSFKERQRLFDLPGSSWADYNSEFISKGGGVFERNAKSIKISSEVKTWLGVSIDKFTPSDLIHEILRAKADLLYNGGIGTYVKSSEENHDDALDRTNDPIRVDANELKIKVVGEGGNLGFTQKARIEFSLLGGRICTDAVDNSAGVDCSDHEVNIKILLGMPFQEGKLTEQARNAILAEMTDDVAHQCLQNNYLQTQLLEINHSRASLLLNTQARMIHSMEKSGRLNRTLEFLPPDEDIAQRRRQRLGLTRPEVAILMAYTKIGLDQNLLATDVPDDPDFDPFLFSYFPRAAQSKFASYMTKHRLKREIISNQLANRLVNRMGTTFIFRVQEEVNASIADIVRAWAGASETFDAEKYWTAVEALDTEISADLQNDLYVVVRSLVERATRWLLRNRKPVGSFREIVKKYSNNVTRLLALLPEITPPENYPVVQEWEKRLNVPNFPPDLGRVLSRIDLAFSFLDIIEVAAARKLPPDTVARNYFELGRALELDWLRDAITKLPRDNRWQSVARSALRDDLYRKHREITNEAIAEGNGSKDFAQSWLERRRPTVESCRQMFMEIRAYDSIDLATLSASLSELKTQLTP